MKCGNVLDKPLSKGRQEVSLSAFAFLFSELVQYNQTQVDNIAELERRLEDAGYAIGARVLELYCHREKGNRRETRLLGILSFIHSTVWRVLFGKIADSLEKGTENEDEYMISEKELLINRFISIPKDMGMFNCGAFVAGIVKVAVVTAHFVPMEGLQRPRTTILIKFAEEEPHRPPRLRHALRQVRPLTGTSSPTSSPPCAPSSPPSPPLATSRSASAPPSSGRFRHGYDKAIFAPMLRSHQRYSEASSNRVRIRRGVRESMLRSPCRSLWLRRKWRLLVHGENSKHASIEAEVKKYE
ncbi:uncharacterized protein A4U43_C01F13280, partial [Asparagus officinalis]